MGFMSSDLYYAGYDFANWSNILAGPDKVPVMWRPGGGAYEDLTPSAFIAKAHSMGRQASALPKEVVSIQSEIENFPYPTLQEIGDYGSIRSCRIYCRRLYRRSL